MRPAGPTEAQSPPAASFFTQEGLPQPVPRELPPWLNVVHEPPRPRAGAPYDLVLLDMDGTVVDEKSSWEWLHEHFGVNNEDNWERYQRGELDDLGFMRSDIALWGKGRRIHLDEVEAILAKAPIMPGARELVDDLKVAGIATCIMSGGLDILARRVCRETGIDMYVANGLVVDAGGWLAGEGTCIVEIRDKGRPTRDTLRALGVAPERAAAVGNSIWDATMFREVAYSIAFNPFPDGVSEEADLAIVEKDMRLLTPHLLARHPS